MEERVTTREHVECGIIESRSSLPLGIVGGYLLKDIPEELAETAALVFPAAQLPFSRLLGGRTAHHPLYLADPTDENLGWQRRQVGEDKAVYVKVESVAALPKAIQGLGVILNPFGLQHYPSEVSLYPMAVRSRARSDALFITIDWGTMTYPEDLSGLPGIKQEIHYNEQALLPAYGRETGWALAVEREILYDEQHTVEEITALLPSDQAKVVRQATTQRDSSFVVRTTMVYRLYHCC